MTLSPPDSTSGQPSPAGPGHVPYVLEPQIVDSLRALNPDDGGALFREIISLYLEDTTTQIAAIRKAAATGDARGAARAAHSLRGSSGNFGALRLAALAQQIEADAQVGRLEAADPRFGGIDEGFAHVKDAIETLLRADGLDAQKAEPPVSHE